MTQLETNTIGRPYRTVAVRHEERALTADDIHELLLGREAYRRTHYVVLKHGGGVSLVVVAKANEHDLFAPITAVSVVSNPTTTRWIEDPDVDVGNASALSSAARRNEGDGVRAYVIKGMFEHVNFIWEPRPLTVLVDEVVPPYPPKLASMAQKVIDFDEDLPPIDLIVTERDLRELAANSPATGIVLPCQSSGLDLDRPLAFLDTRPNVEPDWVLLGCERSRQIYRHFYSREPEGIDICPRVAAGHPSTSRSLIKCCLLERGVELGSNQAVVPWGANLDEVRAALQHLSGAETVPGTDSVG